MMIFFFEERTFKSIALKETCQQKTHLNNYIFENICKQIVK